MPLHVCRDEYLVTEILRGTRDEGSANGGLTDTERVEWILATSRDRLQAEIRRRTKVHRKLKQTLHSKLEAHDRVLGEGYSSGRCTLTSSAIVQATRERRDKLRAELADMLRAEQDRWFADKD